MFPFGKHKGSAYEDVPAHYLLWLADQDWIGQWPLVLMYINSNRQVLESEIDEPDS